MLECAIETRRGGFTLQLECRLASAWTVVFGPSGAGKSTLLRLLAGLDQGACGRARIRIQLEERLLTDTARQHWIPPGRRGCAFVTQNPALFPHLTVGENLAFGLRSLDRAARARRVGEMLELVAATELAGRRPGQLSGGQAQRIALARALATAPRLLLLDEPFSALDGMASDALLERLQAWVTAQGVQVVLATHDATDALATAAEVLLLRDGRRLALGPGAQVLAAERERLRARLGPA